MTNLGLSMHLTVCKRIEKPDRQSFVRCRTIAQCPADCKLRKVVEYWMCKILGLGGLAYSQSLAMSLIRWPLRDIDEILHHRYGTVASCPSQGLQVI